MSATWGRVTRRRVLGAAGGAVVVAGGASGCGLFGDDEPDPPKAPDPLQPVLDEALALATAYDRAAAAEPDQRDRLAPLGADHQAHAAELSRLIGAVLPSAAPAVSPAAQATTTAELRKAEQAAQRTASAAVRAAPPDRVMLVASIAACRAAHAEALT